MPGPFALPSNARHRSANATVWLIVYFVLSFWLSLRRWRVSWHNDFHFVDFAALMRRECDIDHTRCCMFAYCDMQRDASWHRCVSHVGVSTNRWLLNRFGAIYVACCTASTKSRLHTQVHAGWKPSDFPRFCARSLGAGQAEVDYNIYYLINCCLPADERELCDTSCSVAASDCWEAAAVAATCCCMGRACKVALFTIRMFVC